MTEKVRNGNVSVSGVEDGAMRLVCGVDGFNLSRTASQSKAEGGRVRMRGNEQLVVRENRVGPHDDDQKVTATTKADEVKI
jgi:hypothetical protein